MPVAREVACEHAEGASTAIQAVEHKTEESSITDLPRVTALIEADFASLKASDLKAQFFDYKDPI